MSQPEGFGKAALKWTIASRLAAPGHHQRRDWDDMDEYEGGDHIYAPVNAGPIGPDGVPIVPNPRESEESG